MGWDGCIVRLAHSSLAQEPSAPETCGASLQRGGPPLEALLNHPAIWPLSSCFGFSLVRSTALPLHDLPCLLIGLPAPPPLPPTVEEEALTDSP